MDRRTQQRFGEQHRRISAKGDAGEELSPQEHVALVCIWHKALEAPDDRAVIIYRKQSREEHDASNNGTN